MFAFLEIALVSMSNDAAVAEGRAQARGCCCGQHIPPVAPFLVHESAYVGGTLGRRGAAATTPTTAAARALGFIAAVWPATYPDDASSETDCSGSPPSGGTASCAIDVGARADAPPANAVLSLFTDPTLPPSPFTSAVTVRTTVGGMNVACEDWGRPLGTSSCSINATRSSDVAAAAATARMDVDKWARLRDRPRDNAQAVGGAPTDEAAVSGCRGDVVLTVVGNAEVPMARCVAERVRRGKGGAWGKGRKDAK